MIDYLYIGNFKWLRNSCLLLRLFFDHGGEVAWSAMLCWVQKQIENNVKLHY